MSLVRLPYILEDIYAAPEGSRMIHNHDRGPSQKRRLEGQPIFEDADCLRAQMLARRGFTQGEIAFLLRIDLETLLDWSRRPEFANALRRGEVEADASVAVSLFERAVGYDKTAVKIFRPRGATKPIVVRYAKHVPADVAAGIYWLVNRQPERWSQAVSGVTPKVPSHGARRRGGKAAQGRAQISTFVSSQK